MIEIPVSNVDETGRDVLNVYYGRFLLDVHRHHRVQGGYTLTGDMLNEALREFGAVLSDNSLIFEDERMSMLFILRWSR